MGEIVWLAPARPSDALQFRVSERFVPPGEAVTEFAQLSQTEEPGVDTNCCVMLVATLAAGGLAFGSAIALVLQYAIVGSVEPLMVAVLATAVSITLHLGWATFLYKLSQSDP